MFKLYRIKSIGHWLVVPNNSNRLRPLSGSSDKIILHLRALNVSFEEIEYGMTELIKKDHDVATYGIGYGGTGPAFIHSAATK